MKLQNTKGFTLIELLVVITIIGILATGATAIYTSQIQKARDTNRINAIKALESSINQSYQDTSVYPDNTTAFSTTVKPYMTKLPGDPKNGQACYGSGGNIGCAYVYHSGPDQNGITQGGYVMSTAFESEGKATSDGIKDGGLQNNRWEVGNGISFSGTAATEYGYGPLKSDLSGGTLSVRQITLTSKPYLRIYGD